MYRYDEHDQRLVDARVEEFRDQVRRYREGALDEEEFKQLRLRNGLYRQRHAYMLRIAVPYGLLASRQLRTLAFLARRYDRGFGHFTTRQNVQLNWPRLDDVPDMLAHLARVQMHAIQTSGNVVRNITSDPLAGVAADEIEDPRPWCELLRQWSTLHPEFNWLPRKFKIAVSGAAEDRTALELHDIGLRIVRGPHGEHGFRVHVGGGLGRTPRVGEVLREFLPRRELLAYVEAILRIYNLEGRRDNLHKARIKILVGSLGLDAFRERVEREHAAGRAAAPRVDDAALERMRAHFAPPARREAPGAGPCRDALAADPAFARWYRHATRPHKVPGYRIVVVALKAPGTAPGDITADQMEGLADVAERWSCGEVRATHEQNLVLADVEAGALPEVRRALDELGLATPNAGTLADMICCPGLDFCSLANAGSIPVARALQARFASLEDLYDLGEVRVKISGCMNACGHHHVGDIGILGVDKHGEEWYQLTLGGHAGDRASLGERLGAAIPKAAVCDAVAAVVAVYRERRRPGERFLDTCRRVGIAPYRERVYERDPGRNLAARSAVA